MKEINIARAILQGRRAKGVTQEELAQFIGVSKASVSKWETGQSYPDITLLPHLAAYFNISIDELIGYEPWMIRKISAGCITVCQLSFRNCRLILYWMSAMR